MCMCNLVGSVSVCVRGGGMCGWGIWVWGMSIERAPGSIFSPFSQLPLDLGLGSRASQQGQPWQSRAEDRIPASTGLPTGPRTKFSSSLATVCSSSTILHKGKLSHLPGPSLVTDPCFLNMYLLSTYYVSGIRNQAKQMRCLPWGVLLLAREAGASQTRSYGEKGIMTMMGIGWDRLIGGSPPFVQGGQMFPSFGAMTRKRHPGKSPPSSVFRQSLVTHHLSPESAHLAQHSREGPLLTPLSKVCSRRYTVASQNEERIRRKQEMPHNICLT